MASELRVNTLKDASGNNSIATSFVAGGSAKAWHNAASDGASVNDSFNMSSYTDSATGIGVHNFTSALGNANYATMTKLLMNTAATNAHRTIYTAVQSTSSYTEESYYLNSSAALVAEDRQRLSVAHGDLA
jgi:hypothetical protein